MASRLRAIQHTDGTSAMPTTLAQIASAIHVVRGHRVMLDADLAALYRVPTGRLNEQVSRNRGRFPSDFMFRLSAEEAVNLKSQYAISSRWGGRRTPPNVFTEHGAVMLANVLRSRTAVEASIQVVRAFVQLREFALTHEELAQRLDALERKHDAQFKVVFAAIRELMAPLEGPRMHIGFHQAAPAAADAPSRGRRPGVSRPLPPRRGAR